MSDETEKDEAPEEENVHSLDEARQDAEQPSASDTPDELKSYEELVEENTALKSRLLRAMADVENMRRRTEREVQDARSFGISNFARDLLSVADNLHRALETIPSETKDTLDELIRNFILGVEMIDTELHSVFEKHKVQVVHPQGDKFDPNFHQAMVEIPGTDHDHGTVIDVMQKGYLLGERLLRPAMVTVAKGDPTANKASGNSDGEGNNADDKSTEEPGGHVDTTA